jgi:signal transduction histidine kinase
MLKNARIAVAAILFGLAPVFAATPATPTSVEAAAPTKEDVVARVNKAVEYYRQNGRDKTIAELNRRDGAFAKGMDYVDLHDINGVCIAHPRSPDLVGQNRLDTADPHGKHFMREIVDAAKTHQDGWITYLRENPNNGQIEHKIAYWAVHDGLIFKAGTYDTTG